MHIFRRFKDSGTIIGFLIPFALAMLVATLFHLHTSVAKHHQETLTHAGQTTAVNGPLPSADEIAAANQAILAYCNNDLRAGTSCSLAAGSDLTAPGFVEAGLEMNGYFSDGGASRGLALAKGSGSSWNVLWVGEGCIPATVASQYQVPAAFEICSA